MSRSPCKLGNSNSNTAMPTRVMKANTNLVNIFAGVRNSQHHYKHVQLCLIDSW